MTRLTVLALMLLTGHSVAQAGGELRFTLRADPKTFDPLLVDDEPSEQIRYLTGGFLVRVNRLTQRLEPELATEWRVSESGRRIDFTLRSDVRFSNGGAFTCRDVVFTMTQLMDPALHSSTGDAFRSAPGPFEAKCGAGPRSANYSVTLRFAAPVAALASQFDQVALVSSLLPRRDGAVLGPFMVAEHHPGSHIILRRNPYYWKRDPEGRPLPYLDSIRLDIQQNRDTEMLRFRRGELDLIPKVDPELFDRLAAELPSAVVDSGPSLDWEIVMFNQSPLAPIPEYKKAWFRSSAFRLAVSEAINREDICRIVYRGHARPAGGPISPANRFWLNSAVQPPAYSSNSALRRLAAAGFRKQGDSLLDQGGRIVEFSMVTNSGSKLHERAMTLVQQDLAKVGIKLNTVALDFSSLIERISATFNYESCLMAFSNIGIDPNEQMNIWLSSAANHQWNPNQKAPATPWEAEMDQMMQTQNTALDDRKRKAAFDRVQRIVSEQAPFIYLVYPNSLAAVAARVQNVQPARMRPQLYWNVERLAVSKR